jgi:hypothetical protein
MSAPSETPVRIAVSAKSLWGYDYEMTASLARDDPDLRRLIEAEIEDTDGFVLAPSDECDVEMRAVLHEADDAEAMEGALLISGITLGLIPTWYSRKLVLEVEAGHPQGGSTNYVEEASYTAFNWLPTLPFALFWDSERAFRDVARKQSRCVLARMREDWCRDHPASAGGSR